MDEKYTQLFLKIIENTFTISDAKIIFDKYKIDEKVTKKEGIELLTELLTIYIDKYPPENEEFSKLWLSEEFINSSYDKMTSSSNEKLTMNYFGEWLSDFIGMSNSSSEVREVTTIKESYDEENKIVNNFIIHQTIGSGSFGKVKSSLHILTQKKFAIKLLNKKQLEKIKHKSGKTGLDDIYEEIEILKLLNHPNVIR
jgi:hypothetical protein